MQFGGANLVLRRIWDWFTKSEKEAIKVSKVDVVSNYLTESGLTGFLFAYRKHEG